MNYYMADTFDRPDSASSLGSAFLGGAWTAQVGTWGITGNVAYRASGTNDVTSYATLGGLPIQDADIRSVCFFSNGVVNRMLMGLIFRYTDTSNLLRVFFAVSTGYPNNIIVDQSVGGSSTTLVNVTSAGLTQGTLNDVRVVLKANKISVYLNGALRVSPTAFDSTLTSGKCGLLVHRGATDYDDGGSAFLDFYVLDNVRASRMGRVLSA